MDHSKHFVKNREKGVSILFILECLYDYNFKSFKRCIIYIFHFTKVIDLRFKASSLYSNKEIIDLLGQIVGEKIPKKLLYEWTGLSKNTFNKQFKEFFSENDFVGKRKFTLYQVYLILNEWQGPGEWAMPQSYSKQKIANYITGGNLKNLAFEFDAVIGKDSYKNTDKFSPKIIKTFLKHIDMTGENEEEDILQYKEFLENSRFGFGLFLLFKVISENYNKNKLKKLSK